MARKLVGLQTTHVEVRESFDGTLVEAYFQVSMSDRGPVAVVEVFYGSEGKQLSVSVASEDLEELANMFSEAAKVVRTRELVMREWQGS